MWQRQTISKWEKGLSVPDADMLIKIADILEVSVAQLLGATVENETDKNNIAEQLSRINEQLATKNRRTKTVLKIILGIIIGIIVLYFLLIIIGVNTFQTHTQDEIEIITESEE